MNGAPLPYIPNPNMPATPWTDRWRLPAGFPRQNVKGRVVPTSGGAIQEMPFPDNSQELTGMITDHLTHPTHPTYPQGGMPISVTTPNPNIYPAPRPISATPNIRPTAYTPPEFQMDPLTVDAPDISNTTSNPNSQPTWHPGGFTGGGGGGGFVMPNYQPGYQPGGFTGQTYGPNPQPANYVEASSGFVGPPAPSTPGVGAGGASNTIPDGDTWYFSGGDPSRRGGVGPNGNPAYGQQDKDAFFIKNGRLISKSGKSTQQDLVDWMSRYGNEDALRAIRAWDGHNTYWDTYNVPDYNLSPVEVNAKNLTGLAPVSTSSYPTEARINVSPVDYVYPQAGQLNTADSVREIIRRKTMRDLGLGGSSF